MSNIAVVYDTDCKIVRFQGPGGFTQLVNVSYDSAEAIAKALGIEFQTVTYKVVHHAAA